MFLSTPHRFFMAVAVLVSATACCASSVFGQGGRGYPQVIGASGQPYGPTQAEYQYQLRYGRPSPGSHGGGLRFVNGYPGGGGFGGHGGGHYPGGYGFNPFLYMDISPYVAPPSSGYIYYPSTAYYGTFGNTNFGAPAGPQPFMTQPTPAVMQPMPQMGFPATNGFNGFNGINGGATYHFPTLTQPAPVVPQSSPKQQESSLEFQTEGDFQLQQLNYLVAAERYRRAINAARDRADPRYRMAVTLAARSRFSEAVDQLRLAVRLDPTWPQHADSLDKLFGAQNTFEKTRVKQRVAEWTLQDVRDPNRLFLLGALLYMDGDHNARTLIETAILLDGKQDYLLAFMAPRAEPILPVEPAPFPLPKPLQPKKPQPAPENGNSGPNLPLKPIPALPPLPDPVQQGQDFSTDSNDIPPAPADGGTNDATPGGGPMLPPLP